MKLKQVFLSFTAREIAVHSAELISSAFLHILRHLTRGVGKNDVTPYAEFYLYYYFFIYLSLFDFKSHLRVF